MEKVNVELVMSICLLVAVGVFGTIGYHRTLYGTYVAFAVNGLSTGTIDASN